MKYEREESKTIQNICGNYSGVNGKYGKLVLFAVHKVVFKYMASVLTYWENTRKESKRTRRRHKEPVHMFFSTPRDIKVCKS